MVVKCPKCNHFISDEVSECPHCGYVQKNDESIDESSISFDNSTEDYSKPFSGDVLHLQPLEVGCAQDETPIQYQQVAPRGVLKTVIPIVLGVILLIGICIAVVGLLNSSHNQQESDPDAVQSVLMDDSTV